MRPARSAPVPEVPVLDTLQLAFVQRGLAEVLLLSVACGLVGTWVVLRGMAFFSHAVGTAAFPGLVIADGVGFAVPLGALGATLAFALLVAALGRAGDGGWDAVTAVCLVAFLALGIVLASDVYGSSGAVDSLLFGSLLLIDGSDLLLAAGASLLAVAAAVALGPRWLAAGFDAAAARSLGMRSRLPDLALLVVVGTVTIATLAAVGALLASALVLVPAATARLWTTRLGTWQVAATLLAAAEGVAGILLSVETDAPPGATIAVIAGVVFAVALAARRLALPGRRGLVAGAAAAALLALAAGCGGGSDDGRLDVVVSTTQLADITREVGGDRVDVTGLLAANTDPHDYEPRAGDVRAVAGADLVLTSGLGLDDWMNEVVDQAGGDAVVSTVGGSTAATVVDDGDPVAARPGDPHWWHDPRLVESAVLTIRTLLSSADPAGAGVFSDNGAAYLARLRALDRGIAACIDAVPPARRVMVTDHDALGFFADRYGIRIVGTVIPARVTSAQASAADVARLSALIRRTGVRTVFPSQSVSPRLAEAIASESGAAIGDPLYADTLGPEGSGAETYIGMMASNADAITRGLTGGARGCPLEGIR